MGLVISFFSMLAGIIAVLCSSAVSKQNMNKFKKEISEKQERIKKFKKEVANREVWDSYLQKLIDKDFANEVDKKYESVVEELNLPKDVWLSWRYRKVFSFAVYMASIGKLDPKASWEGEVPVQFSWGKIGCGGNDHAKLYKWFDKSIHSFHPSFNIIRVEDGNAYRYMWNLSPTTIGTPVSLLSDKEVLQLIKE